MASWLHVLADCGFLCDVGFAVQVEPWRYLLLRYTDVPSTQALAYMTQAWQATHNYQTHQQSVATHYRQQWAQTAHQLTHLHQQPWGAQANSARTDGVLQESEQVWESLQETPAYEIIKMFQDARAWISPPHSRRDRLLTMLLGWMIILRRRGFYGLRQHLLGEWRWRYQNTRRRFPPLLPKIGRRSLRQQYTQIEPPRSATPPSPHTEDASIVICVHNALTDVRSCLAAVIEWTNQPYQIILVDDGSAPDTANFVADFARRYPHVMLLRNESALGYTRAANLGMQASRGDYVALLNSDTLVTQGWLERLLACARHHPRIGMVGPLSNTSSWQSIPQVAEGGDWAENPLAEDISLRQWAKWIGQHSPQLYPEMPFLNGFCLLIKRQLLEQVGLFDEETFPEGYGEENDYALRARKAGWRLALADDAYVYHAQSRSYSHGRRQQLTKQAGERLARKHNQRRIEQDVAYCRGAPVLEGIRARASYLAERYRLIDKGQQCFAGRRVLFILPLDGPAGGGHVVIDEARAMQKMGVEVHLLNLPEKRAGFERSFPNLDLPVVWSTPQKLPAILRGFDAAIATWHESVAWLALTQELPNLRLGYYIQDFEPWFYPDQSDEYHAALSSYTLIPAIHAFTKTDWTRQLVARQTGVDAMVVGPSFNTDLFLPRPSQNGEKERADALHIVAMIRPSSPRRAPELTMRLLGRLWQRYGARVRITLFGVDERDPGWGPLPKNFDWALAGVIDHARVAALLAQADIFVDFSTYQAMGLTALEAMACGAAVILPKKGGTGSFARHGDNSLFVDTASEEACWEALVSLVEDSRLRQEIQRQAIWQAPAYFPERAALTILSLLFGENGR
jgi:GT2 family glycosyltransferase/glycosyltransferase involved in cell wall biosynthesis